MSNMFSLLYKLREGNNYWVVHLSEKITDDNGKILITDNKPNNPMKDIQDHINKRFIDGDEYIVLPFHEKMLKKRLWSNEELATLPKK